MSHTLCCAACVSQADAGVVEKFGQYSRIAEPGLNWIIPCVETLQTRTLRVQQMRVTCGTKSRDNVFCQVEVTVQYQVLSDKLWDAFYRTNDPRVQIEALVTNVVRSFLPKQDLDEAFSSKDEMAHHIMEELQTKMSEMGYTIHQTLITELDPDRHVKESMNQINANQRLRVAAGFKAEAEKIMLVKAAEAEAESKYLSGVGVARQRAAIVDGLRDSIVEFSQNVNGATSKDVMDLLLLTQYFDMLRDIGDNTRNPAQLFVPHAPLAVQQLREQLRSSFMSEAPHG